MATLSAGQIAFVAKGAGFSGDSLVTAVAIALAESSGNADAVGDVALQTGTWGPSVGLWQIRSLNVQKNTGGQRDEVANHNPATNAKNAFAISSSGTNFHPWSTFGSGAYLAHIGAARTGAGAPNANGIPAGLNTSGSAPVSGGGINPFTALLNGSLWLRIAAFIVGGALLIFALLKVTGADTAVTSAIKSTVKVAAFA